MTEHAAESGSARPVVADATTAQELEALRTELAAARAALEERGEHSRADREREVLLRQEIQHRLRNTLALVRSVFARTIETAETLEDVDSHFRGRLDVLARHQGTNRIGERQDLENLIRNEFQDFRFGDLPGITIRGPEVRLPTDQAQPLALAIHELVTNALKFGALLVQGASLSVTWAVSDDVLELVWAEAGVPIGDTAPLRRGFSRQFIEDALPYQIGAEARFELRADGVLCLIHLPLPQTEVAEGES